LLDNGSYIVSGGTINMADEVIVVDNAFNRANYSDIIGKRYPAAHPPSYAQVKPVEKMGRIGATTESSLDYWQENKKRLGPVTAVSCDASEGNIGHLRIAGKNSDFELGGCTCGYGGEGPQGTAKILQDLGLSEKEAWALAQSNKFLIYFDESGLKFKLDGEIIQ
jgi:hypothetical protein